MTEEEEKEKQRILFLVKRYRKEEIGALFRKVEEIEKVARMLDLEPRKQENK